MGQTVLVADDHVTIQKVLELTLEGYRTVIAEDGDEALRRVRELRPDLVICDARLPRRDGYDVCRAIKEDPALSHIPVLLLTGAFEPFDADRATAAGCDAVFTTPFVPPTLLDKVKELL